MFVSRWIGEACPPALAPDQGGALTLGASIHEENLKLTSEGFFIQAPTILFAKSAMASRQLASESTKSFLA